MKIDKFNFFRSYFEGIKRLKIEDQLQAYSEIFSYVFDDIYPENETIAFTFIKHHLESTKASIRTGSSGGEKSSRKGSKNKSNPPYFEKVTPLIKKSNPPTEKKVSNKNKNKELEIELEKEKEKEKEIYTQNFCKFWESYKKVGNKKKAFELWKKNKFEEKLPEILQAVELYNSQLDDEKYRKHADGFLNGHLETWLEKAKNPEEIELPKKEKLSKLQAEYDEWKKPVLEDINKTGRIATPEEVLKSNEYKQKIKELTQ